MDITRYIALFLLKNKYCHIHGLGNLELKKKPATHEGDVLHAGGYVAVLSQTGSIDDAFPNFIANNEHVSIAKASNEIREFAAAAKEELAAGKDIVVPSIGKYTSINGRISFILDPSFTYSQQSSIPAITVRPEKPVEKPVAPAGERTYSQPQEKSSGNKVNWGLIILWIMIVAVIAVVAVFAMRYLTSAPPSDAAAQDTTTTVTPPVAAPTPVAAPVTDSVSVDSSSAAPAVSADTPVYNFTVGTYKTIAAAAKREKQLKGFGRDASVITKDSVTFYVNIAVKALPADTVKLKDSLGALYNKNGVSIYR